MSRHRKTEWFDDDRFWTDLYPFMFTEKRFADTDDEMEKTLLLVKPEGKDVLDLCCGPGRCSVALARRGFKVSGVDRTKAFLEKAKALAESAEVEVEWVLDDMRDFVRPGSFDLVISMFTSLGYFEDKGDDISVLENMFLNLRSGGACLIELMGKELLARIFQPTTSTSLPDGSLLVERHEVFDDWTRIRNEWIVIREGKVRSHVFHHTIYSGQELRDQLEQVGFSEVTLYGNLDGDPYDEKARRLIAVGRKPATG